MVDKLGKIGADAVAEQLGALGMAPAKAEELLGFLSVRDLGEARPRCPPTPARRSTTRPALRLWRTTVSNSAWCSTPRSCAGSPTTPASCSRPSTRPASCARWRAAGATTGCSRRWAASRCPRSGFGFGDVVILELLEARGRLPQLARGLDAVVIAIPDAGEDAAVRRAALRHASALRRAGRSVEVVTGVPLKRALRNADRAGAAQVRLLGADELRSGAVKVRDLASGEERSEPLAKKIAWSRYPRGAETRSIELAQHAPTSDPYLLLLCRA